MTKDRIVQVLKNIKFTTTHYEVPVEVISDAQFEAAADQILLLIQTPKDDIQPQLKQTDVGGSKLFRCADEDRGKERCTSRCKECQRMFGWF